MRTGGLPADPGFGRVGCWDRVLTRTWHEPPSESRPQQLTDLRDGLKGLGKERDAARREREAAELDAAHPAQTRAGSRVSDSLSQLLR